jgi:antitoxin YefM
VVGEDRDVTENSKVKIKGQKAKVKSELVQERALNRSLYCGTIYGTTWGAKMTSLSASEARKRLYNLVDEVKDSHQPIQIVGKRNSAVLISEEDWRAIDETLYLTSIPGMRASIKKGLKTPIEKCDTEIDW